MQNKLYFLVLKPANLNINTDESFDSTNWNIFICMYTVQDKLRFDPESEIATTGLRVSLICPVSVLFFLLCGLLAVELQMDLISVFSMQLVKMRLGVPCRVLTCAHLQCFDAVFFLQMNEKKPTWTCPVCDKPAPFELLTIDG